MIREHAKRKEGRRQETGDRENKKRRTDEAESRRPENRGRIKYKESGTKNKEYITKIS